MEEVPLLLCEILHLLMNWVSPDSIIIGLLARERTVELSIKIFSPLPFGLLLESEPLFVGRLSTKSNSLLPGANKRESFRMGSSSDAEPINNGLVEWEIKKRIEGNDLSIIGGPSLFPVTELSTELFSFWNSISSWGFRFVKCGAGSFLSTSSGSKEGDQGDPDFKSPLYSGRFLLYQARMSWGGQGRRIESRGDAYASSFLIGFPQFSVSSEGDKG
ncbi:hypothetical protein M9H77_30902 [Catharanthus roseus]|uniref:Uncharacterized protein n=1 Tax=Catharanthus roseus TaxID=4058 RepID=A0ACB9ZZN0_CATRO|nr:hypothetical protein M9H77_30902 [Catharanthus roseus]